MKEITKKIEYKRKIKRENKRVREMKENTRGVERWKIINYGWRRCASPERKTFL